MRKPCDRHPLTLSAEEAHKALLWIAVVFVPFIGLIAYEVYELFQILK